METVIDKKILWNEGAKYGLILGIVSGAFIFLNMFTASLTNGSSAMKILAVALNAGLWLIKFIGCLWLVRFFMLKFALNHPGINNKHTFRLGIIIALTSAIIYAGINLLNICVISPGQIEDAINTLMESYNSLGMFSDSDKITLERTLSWYPQIAFFSNFIYCFLYGTVVSLIFSNGIPPKDIFADNNDNIENR